MKSVKYHYCPIVSWDQSRDMIAFRAICKSFPNLNRVISLCLIFRKCLPQLILNMYHTSWSITQLKLFQNPLWFYMATGHKYLSRSVSILGARIGPEAKPLTGQSGRGGGKDWKVFCTCVIKCLRIGDLIFSSYLTF